MPAILVWVALAFLFIGILFSFINDSYLNYVSKNYIIKLSSQALPYNKSKLMTLENFKSEIIDYKDDIELTIDKEMQVKAESFIYEYITRKKGLRALTFAIEPKTGEILAYTEYPYVKENNMLTQEPVNQGHIFLPVTYSIGLISNKINTKTTVIDDDKIKINKWITIKNHSSKKFTYPRELTIEEAIKYKSAVIPVKVAFKVGTGEFNKYLNQLSLNQKTNIDLIKENDNLSKIHSDDSSIAHLSYGYGEYKLTHIQMASFYCAIMNEGKIVTPHFKKNKKVNTKDIMSKDIAKNMYELTNLQNSIEGKALNTSKRTMLEYYLQAKKLKNGKNILIYTVLEVPIQSTLK